jgi:hypothetical protein
MLIPDPVEVQALPGPKAPGSGAALLTFLDI